MARRISMGWAFANADRDLRRGRDRSQVVTWLVYHGSQTGRRRRTSSTVKALMNSACSGTDRSRSQARILK